MHTLLFERAAEKPRGRSRTLVVKDGTVWMWPGVPLTVNLDGQILPLPDNCVWFWITRLHGFEADPMSVELSLSRAADQLNLGNPDAAQIELDRSGLDRLSPEGDVLMTATAKRLGVAPARMPVGFRSAPWGSGELRKDIGFFDRFVRSASNLEKTWNEDDHPRLPKGSSDGGQFAANPGAEASGPTDPKPGIGHNSDQFPEDFPEIPEEAPSLAPVRNALLRGIGTWLLERGIVALIPGVGEAAMIVQLGIWLYEYLPEIEAYLQPPRSLDDLQNAVGNPTEGTEVHHIVEQKSARQDGFSEAEINSRENLARISTLKHYQISGWYSTPNPEFNGLSPRDYLRGKDWAERVRVGKEALTDFGVLKP